MRVIVLGDLQAGCGIKRYPETDKDGTNLRLLDTIKELDRIRLLCVKRKVEAVCILGDIFEARNTLDTAVLNQVYRAFHSYVDAGLRLILLVGNHDRCDVGREHSLEVFKPFCCVVDTPRSLSLCDGSLVAVPFHPDPRAVVKAIKQHVTPTTRLLLLHTAIQDVQLPSGKLWREGITLGDIPEHVMCLMGHYHRWREVRQGNVYYVGSLLQVDRGDMGIEKYFAVYNSEKHSVQFPPTQGPKFVNVNVSFMPGQSFNAGEYSEAEFAGTYRTAVAGNFVTVSTIPPDWTDLGAIERALQGLGARHVEFAMQTQTTIVPPQRLTHQAEIPAAQEVIEQYVEASETPLDKATLVEQAMEVVVEVLQEEPHDDEIIVEVN